MPFFRLSQSTFISVSLACLKGNLPPFHQTGGIPLLLPLSSFHRSLFQFHLWFLAWQHRRQIPPPFAGRGAARAFPAREERKAVCADATKSRDINSHSKWKQCRPTCVYLLRARACVHFLYKGMRKSLSNRIITQKHAGANRSW